MKVLMLLRTMLPLLFALTLGTAHAAEEEALPPPGPDGWVTLNADGKGTNLVHLAPEWLLPDASVWENVREHDYTCYVMLHGPGVTPIAGVEIPGYPRPAGNLAEAKARIALWAEQSPDQTFRGGDPELAHVAIYDRWGRRDAYAMAFNPRQGWYERYASGHPDRRPRHLPYGAHENITPHNLIVVQGKVWTERVYGYFEVRTLQGRILYRGM